MAGPGSMIAPWNARNWGMLASWVLSAACAIDPAAPAIGAVRGNEVTRTPHVDPSAVERPIPDTDGTPSDEVSLVHSELYVGGAIPGSGAPLVVVLHGHGGSAKKMARRFRRLQSPARIVSFEGPYPVGRRGHRWLQRRSWNSTSAGTDAELHSLAAGIEHGLIAAGVAPGTRLQVVGFSQGAAVAATLSSRQPSRVTDLILMSTVIPETLDFSNSGPSPRVLMLHGDRDRRYHRSQVHHSATLLAASGWEVDLWTFPRVKHALSVAAWDEMRAALRDRLRGHYGPQLAKLSPRPGSKPTTQHSALALTTTAGLVR
jgi:predicted esterase